MRERENVVEAVILILWRYWVKPAIYWYTYPFLRTVIPMLSLEWETYCTAKRHERERKAKEEEAGAVDLEAGPIVHQTTDEHGRLWSVGKFAQSTRDVRWSVGAYPRKRKVRVRRHQSVTPGSNFRYVSYTHEDGTVDWGIERIPGTEIEVGWQDG
jgi:hypothetical protein